MAPNPVWNTEKLSSHAPRAGAREPGASAATRRVEGAPATATADGGGPDFLGSAIEGVDELAAYAAGGAARDGGAVAPSGLQAVLGMEESATMRSAYDQHRAPRSDSADKLRMSYANPLWGAPRIHGELLKLATVNAFRVRPRHSTSAKSLLRRARRGRTPMRSG